MLDVSKVPIQKDINSSNGYIFLVVMSIATVLYSRLFTYLGMPSLFNFVHYFVIFIFAFIMIFQAQTLISIKLLAGLFLLSAGVIISAVLNTAGIINVLLDYLIVSQPILFIYLLNNKKWSENHLIKVRRFLLLFIILSTLFVFFQYFILGETNDQVRGVFLGLGAGSHVTGAIALSACIYFLDKKYINSKFYRIIFLVSSISVLLFTDNKQSIAVFLISVIILLVLNFSKLKKVIGYLFLLIFFIIIVVLLANTIFPAIAGWARIDYVILGIKQKNSIFEIFTSYHDSFLSFLFGLGPGHTVSRLGQLIPDYYKLLSDLGTTTSLITEKVIYAQESNWVSNTITGSSMWSLFFSFAGVWGDLGLFGTMIYMGLWLLVYKNFCSDDKSKYLLITVLVHGLVFQWWEEPAYMIFVVSLISLKFQETLQLKNNEVKTIQR